MDLVQVQAISAVVALIPAYVLVFLSLAVSYDKDPINSHGIGDTRDSALVRRNFFRHIFQRIDVVLRIGIGKEDDSEHHKPQSDKQPEY